MPQPRRWLYIVISLGIFVAGESFAAKTGVQHAKPAVPRFSGLQAAATNEDTDTDTGSNEGSAEEQEFVQPFDFSDLFGGQDTGATTSFFGQPQVKRAFPAGSRPTSAKQAAFPFGDDTTNLFGNSNVDEGFRPQDFIKSKGAGAKQQKSFVFFNQGQAVPLKASKFERKPVQKAKQQAEDPFEEDEVDDDEPLFVNEDDSAENERIKAEAAPTKHRHKENRYPKYSSYYHATPKGQAQEAKQTHADGDDIENQFGSAEEEETGTKGEDSGEDEAEDAQAHHHQVRTYPTKYSAAHTAPKNTRPLASNKNQQKAAYNDDPFFNDPPGYPIIDLPGNANGKSGSLRKGPVVTGYVDRAIRPAPIQFGNFEQVGRKPFRPSPPDPLYSKPHKKIPSYDFDRSPSAEYHEAHLKPKRAENGKSASLTAPTKRSGSNKKANCKKVEKQISNDPDKRFRRDAMTCFVCDDPTSGGTYEQCAYGTEPKTQAYYVGRSQQFRSADKDKPFSYRQRRFLQYRPYLSLPAAAPAAVTNKGALKRKTRQEHDDGFPDAGFSYDTGVSDEKDDYRFGPEYFTHDGDSEAETGESAQLKAAESMKEDTPNNCQKVQKGNMICMVCKESKTGGNYEQCSYGSEPQKSSYSYGKSKSYGTPKKSYTERHRRYISKGNGASKQPQEKLGNQKEKIEPAPKQKSNDENEDKTHSEEVDDDLPKDIAEKSEPITGEVEISENVPRKGNSDFNFDQFERKPGNAVKASATEQKGPSDSEGKQTKYDDYFSILFPEYSKARDNVKKAEGTEYPFDHDDNDHFPAETKDLTSDFLVPNFFSSVEPNKKDLEKMLGEFTQKDRSECKKVMKDQMTCFQCVDTKGMEHEECMFVAASEPKTSHLAYHESKEFKIIDPKKGGTTKTPRNDSHASPTANILKMSQETTTTTRPTIRSRGSKRHESATTTSTPEPSSATASGNKSRKRETQVISLSRRTRGIKRGNSRENHSAARENHSNIKEEKVEDAELEVEEEVPETGDVRETGNMEAGSAAVAATAAEELSNGEIPAEFKDPVGPEGLYSDDTKPVFDEKLQLTLPKYMLSKSDHEAIFDEVLASGS